MREHAWMTIAVGRVCVDCKTAQLRGEEVATPCNVTKRGTAEMGGVSARCHRSTPPDNAASVIRRSHEGRALNTSPRELQGTTTPPPGEDGAAA